MEDEDKSKKAGPVMTPETKAKLALSIAVAALGHYHVVELFGGPIGVDAPPSAAIPITSSTSTMGYSSGVVVGKAMIINSVTDETIVSPAHDPRAAKIWKPST